MEAPVDGFEQLFEAAPGSGGGGLAVAQLERIFGSIIRFVQGQGLAPEGDNWLVTVIAIFNTAGLLAVMVITFYTILTVVFDTAADGKTFGQGTDTRYTIMRSVLGAIFFVPIAKGFTLGQIILLWLPVMQGSALGDYSSARVAEMNISGQNFVQPSKLQGTVDSAISAQFSNALNALVVGNICAEGLNNINRQITASTDDTGNVVSLERYDDVVITNRWRYENYGDVAPKREQVIVRRWTDTTDTYRGSNNICGSVSFSQPISFERSGYDIFDDVRLIASQSMIQNYRAAIDGMTADAESIAARIRAGDNQEALREMGVNAVNRARSTYIAGISDDLLEEGSPAYEQYLAAIEDVQTATLEKVTQDGWLLAASWQRGISLAVAEYRSSLGNLEIKAAAENNASRYISRHDLDSSIWTGRDANPIASAVMASMADYQNIWSTVAGQIAGDVRRNGAGASGMAGGAGEVDGILNNLFSSMVDMFAVRDDAGYSDPMIDVTEYGHGLIIAGGAVKAAAKASDWAPLAGAAVGGPGGYAAGVVVDQVGDVLLHPLGTGLLIAGFIVAAILPLLPVIYYFSAIISWLILVVESMFGLPLAVLTLFTPARDGTLIGTWNRVLLTIFGVFLRPIFTVAGFFFGMLLIAVALDFAYLLFQDMILMVQAQGTVLRIVGLLGILVGFVIVSFYTVLLGSSMITQIGDGAMAAIGVAFTNAQGAMNVGEQAHGALRVGRAIQPIPLGQIRGGDAAGRLPSAPGHNGGPGGGSGGAAGRGIMAVAAKGLAAPAAIGAAAKGAASKVASVPRGVRGQTLRNEIRTRLLPPPTRNDTGGGKS